MLGVDVVKYNINTLRVMKTLLLLSVITTSILASLQGYSQVVTAKNVPLNNLLAQARNKNQLELTVALPAQADITFKGGESGGGRVMEIDTKQQKILIQRGNRTALYDLEKIEKLSFRNPSIAYRSNGQEIIRGERDRPRGQPITWNGVPLNDFRIKDAAKGQAVVVLKPPVVSPGLLRGIGSVGNNPKRTYVVEQLQFNLQKKSINIVATPY